MSTIIKHVELLYGKIKELIKDMVQQQVVVTKDVKGSKYATYQLTAGHYPTRTWVTVYSAL